VAKKTTGLPKPAAVKLSKSDLFAGLTKIDNSISAQRRIKRMEDDFRSRIETHLQSLAGNSKAFRQYNTNPFVLLFYSNQRRLRRIKEIEDAIVPAKVFSSMETSAGRMVERVVLSHYGWQCVDSAMHTTESVIDGRKIDGDTLRLITLKSGPRCINDSMTDSISSELVKHVADWAKAANVNKVEFTIGVLYGTRKKSNKKDWHTLRKACNAVKTLGTRAKLIEPPDSQWHCHFKIGSVDVAARIRIGKSLWDMVGGKRDAYTELLCAIIRASIEPTNAKRSSKPYEIKDIAEIVSLTSEQKRQNFTVLQKSQVEWFLLMSAHFCEQLID
jgi:hypothetical protein